MENESAALGVELKNNLEALEVKVIAEIQKIISEHKESRKTADAIARSLSNFNSSNLEPVCRKKNKDSRHYVYWTSHNTKLKKLNKSWSKEIKPTARGYTEAQLKKYTSVQEECLVLETENKLAPLRKYLYELSDAKTAINRQINKLLKKEQSND